MIFATVTFHFHDVTFVIFHHQSRYNRDYIETFNSTKLSPLSSLQCRINNSSKCRNCYGPRGSLTFFTIRWVDTTVARKSSLGGFTFVQGVMTSWKFIKNQLIYGVLYFTLGGLRALLGGLSPPKTPWRRGWTLYFGYPRQIFGKGAYTLHRLYRHCFAESMLNFSFCWGICFCVKSISHCQFFILNRSLSTH